MLIENHTVQHIDYTENYYLIIQCQSFSLTSFLKNGWLVSADGLHLRRVNSEHGINYRYEPYEKGCFTTFIETRKRLLKRGDIGYIFNSNLEFDFFCETFTNYYCAFSLREIDWKNVCETVYQKSSKVVSEQDFFQVLSQTIAPLQDAHVVLEWEGEEDIEYVNAETIWDRYRILAIDQGIQEADEQWTFVFDQVDRLTTIKKQYAHVDYPLLQLANGKIHCFRISPEIGVLIIDEMEDFTQSDFIDEDTQLTADLNAIVKVFPEVYQALSDCSHIAIDLRHNTGGFDQISQLLMTHFIASETSIYKKQVGNEIEIYSLKPAENNLLLPERISVLTSASTLSAGELLAMMLRQLPQATLIGEPSQGILSDILEKQLPCGIKFGVSNERYLTMEGEWFEKHGIPVSLTVPYGCDKQLLEQQDWGMEFLLSL